MCCNAMKTLEKITEHRNGDNKCFCSKCCRTQNSVRVPSNGKKIAKTVLVVRFSKKKCSKMDGLKN